MRILSSTLARTDCCPHFKWSVCNDSSQRAVPSGNREALCAIVSGTLGSFTLQIANSQYNSEHVSNVDF